MLRYLVARVCWAAVLVVAMATVTFVIFHVIPTDPARFLVRASQPTDAQLKAANHLLGTDRPLAVQYGDYLWQLAHGSLGTAWTGARPGIDLQTLRGVEVRPLIVRAAGVSLSLLAGAALLWFVAGVAIGSFAAWRRGSVLDHAATGATLVGVSVHPILVALLLQLYVGRQLGWLPSEGYVPLREDPGRWASHLVLPWLAFSMVFLARYVLLARSFVDATLREDFVRTAAAKGAGPLRILYGHALRNALLPLVALLGADLAVGLGSVVYVEWVFRLRGLGALARFTIGGDLSFDLPVLQGIVIASALLIAAATLVVDLVIAWLDPRIRLSGASA